MAQGSVISLWSLWGAAAQWVWGLVVEWDSLDVCLITGERANVLSPTSSLSFTHKHSRECGGWGGQKPKKVFSVILSYLTYSWHSHFCLINSDFRVYTTGIQSCWEVFVLQDGITQFSFLLQSSTNQHDALWHTKHNMYHMIQHDKTREDTPQYVTA